MQSFPRRPSEQAFLRERESKLRHRLLVREQLSLADPLSPALVAMESYPLPHHGATVHLALFHPIHNAAALRSRLVSASTLPQDEVGNRERSAVDFAFVDARMVRPSPPAPCPAGPHTLTLASALADHLEAPSPHGGAAGAPRPGRRRAQDQDAPLRGTVDARAGHQRELPLFFPSSSSSSRPSTWTSSLCCDVRANPVRTARHRSPTRSSTLASRRPLRRSSSSTSPRPPSRPPRARARRARTSCGACRRPSRVDWCRSMRSDELRAARSTTRRCARSVPLALPPPSSSALSALTARTRADVPHTLHLVSLHAGVQAQPGHGAQGLAGGLGRGEGDARPPRHVDGRAQGRHVRGAASHSSIHGAGHCRRSRSVRRTARARSTRCVPGPFLRAPLPEP